MKILLIILVLSISTGIFAGPGVVGNGAGGIKRNGVYKTFHTAKIYVLNTPEAVVPGAELYVKAILSLGGTDVSKALLLNTALQLGGHKFFKIAKDKMDALAMEKLLEEYVKIANLPSKDLVIYAVTDIEKKITYLLPSFYELSEIEQATILFHETYWMINPKAKYEEVVDAEVYFQQFLEQKEAGNYDVLLPRLLAKLLSDPSVPLKSAFKEDMRT